MGMGLVRGIPGASANASAHAALVGGSGTVAPTPMPDTDRGGSEFQQAHMGAVAEGVLGHQRDSSPRSVLRIGDKVMLSIYASMTPARELQLHPSSRACQGARYGVRRMTPNVFAV